MTLPRLVVAAPSTGQGKTTIATGLMAALRAAGRDVSGHKVGPDYIDPGYHALATGRPGRNLDPHLVGEGRVAPLLLHGAVGADVAVIEGVMGLYDGRLGTDGFASTAHVASLTRTPVLLVLDVAGLSRSAAAIAAGMAAYDPTVEIAGVVLNRAGSDRNTTEIERSLERTGLPVLGVLPSDDRLAAPSRHLGLVPAAERDGSVRMIEHLGEQVARHLDLDAILDVARSAPEVAAEPWDPVDEVDARASGRPVVAMAGGRAFTFRYAETGELLTAAGCDVTTFDPLTDPGLPPGTAGIYLGGGFPEMYAAELAANESLLRELRTAVADGVPTVAECAGLLYLAESLDGVPMAGAIPTSAAMSERLILRYPVATAASDSLLTRAGERVTGHEFHRTRTTPEAGRGGWRPAWEVEGDTVGFAGDTLHASYLHVHWAGHPRLAQRFAQALGAGSPEESVPPAEPLRHHGDTEARPGLLDFAVNVYAGPRPPWLDRALHESIASAASYPDATAARAALARRHGRAAEEVLPTAGAAEAFSLLAQARPWGRPAVVHPQFTEPHAALEAAGHTVTTVVCRADDDFALDPGDVPDDADLVVVGNPTNPTGVLHPRTALRALARPGRVLAVDEAFLDAVPGEPESLLDGPLDGVVVIRSLTKQWSIPGIRAGYAVGDPAIVAELARLQPPWSVSAPALAAMLVCSTDEAAAESAARAATLASWREVLESGLRERGIPLVPGAAPYVLARPGAGVHAALRDRGVAVRRADTFPGLDGSWVRVAVRPPEVTARLLAALDAVLQPAGG
ncbi:cobyrinate a,c-diamide synthase [Nocardioides sp. KR10-350]|uniref:cobyrinate a,c-diamide synthase n=1 Tax=Nocardioides cheoyonin TaxID=3156615 RepID=UPI0032B4DA7F